MPNDNQSYLDLVFSIRKCLVESKFLTYEYSISFSKQQKENLKIDNSLNADWTAI